MLITRKNFDKLEEMNLTEIGCVYLCPVCIELSDILPKASLIEEIICRCSGEMELIMVEVPDEKEK